MEIALDVARKFEKLDMVIIGSGDSDFLEVMKFAREKKKTFWILCFEKGVSWEMRRLPHVFLEDIKEEIAQKKPQHNG